MSILKQALLLLTETGSLTSGITFDAPPLRDFEEENSSFRGLFEGSVDKSFSEHSIWINTHAMAGFDDPIEAFHVLIHEGIHAMGLQLGYIFHTDPKLLGKFLHDGALWYHLRTNGASIHPRIRRPYRNQFHEIVSFQEGYRYEAIAEDIINSDFAAA